MSIDDLAAEMKAGKYAFGFKGTQAQGSGAGSSGSVKLPANLANLPPVERLKAARRMQISAA